MTRRRLEFPIRFGLDGVGFDVLWDEFMCGVVLDNGFSIKSGLKN